MAAADDATLDVSLEEALPPNVASRLSFQTGGFRSADQDRDVLILWNEFKACYPSEELAAAALDKNTAVILPQTNSPAKIAGSFGVLVERFGLVEAQDIISINPGILSCTADSLSKQSDEEIRRATELVTTLDENKGLIKAWVLLSFFSFPAFVAWRVGSVRGWW